MAARRSKNPKARLEEYRRKRDFARTAEPEGGAAPASEGRLFVVQKHAARQLHYDFRLELDGVLKSWAVPRGPCLDPQQKPLAVHVEDHPIEYGSFEGIIPSGEYGAGTVMLWDRGRWEPIGDASAGLEKGDLKFRLHGEKLRGSWVLARMGGKAGGDGRNWLLIKKRDDEARPVESYNVLSEEPFSVQSGRSMEEIARDPEAVWTDGEARPAGGAAARRRAGARRSGPGPSALPGARKAALPESVKPQLATRVSDAPGGDDWLHEVKLDGYRMIARIDGGQVRLLTRNGHDWTERMPQVAKALGRLPVESAILDGEIAILDAGGRCDFQALQNAFRGGRRAAGFVYFVFDAIHAGGYDLRKVPLVERKAYLADLLERAPSAKPTVQYCDHIVGNGPLAFEEAARAGLEGIVSKRVASPYESRRTDSWVKVKCTSRQEFVVGGYTLPSRSESGVGALVLGQHDAGGRLVYCGRVGTGFSEQAVKALEPELLRLARDTPPFADPGSDPAPQSVRWVEPRLVVEVEFGAWTNDGLVRHASFKGVREDVDPRAVTRETPKRAAGVVRAPASPKDAFVAGVRISNPSRTVYPEDGVTKVDVAGYYEAIAGRMLPYVAGRPLSLVRCPLGLADEAFYQRELGEGFPPAIRGVTIGRGRSKDHAIVIDDLEGLVSLVQMGVLEIHAWGCRLDNTERPDHLVFDLDPGPGITWEHIVESAKFVRDYLADLGLESFAKTSGGKGVHVVVPITRRTGWADAKAFAGGVAGAIVRIAPLNFVATMSKVAREQRIYVDYLRNQLGATSVAPWSTRARPGATVSTPLAWEELSADLEPRDLTVRTVLERAGAGAPDPWERYARLRQTITVDMKRAVRAAP